jgi:hypothetical protein
MARRIACLDLTFMFPPFSLFAERPADQDLPALCRRVSSVLIANPHLGLSSWRQYTCGASGGNARHQFAMPNASDGWRWRETLHHVPKQWDNDYSSDYYIHYNVNSRPETAPQYSHAPVGSTVGADGDGNRFRRRKGDPNRRTWYIKGASG